MTKSEKALNLFSNNFNCAQAVFGAFAEDFGIDLNQALKTSTALGAGMSGQGNICGALSGGLLVIGLKFGSDQTTGPDAKQFSYRKGEVYINAFAQTLGSCICSDLLGMDPEQPVDWEKARSEGKFESVCPVIVETAVLLLEEIIKS